MFDYSTETYSTESSFMEQKGQKVSSKDADSVLRASSSRDNSNPKGGPLTPKTNRAAKITPLTFNNSVNMDENVNENVNEKVSLLTILLEQSKLNSTDERGNTMNYDDDDQLSLTIYLPNGDSITVFVPETSIVQDVIRQTLQSHQKKRLMPALEYTKPGMYELRIHEGDGEPDRDFPALELKKYLSDFNLDEYCLCEVEGAGESLRDMYVSTSRTSIVPPQMVSNMSGNLFTSGPPPPPSYQSGRYSSLGIVVNNGLKYPIQMIGAAAQNTHATIPMTTSDGSLHDMSGDSNSYHLSSSYRSGGGGGGGGNSNKRYSHNSGEGNRDRTSSNDSFEDSDNTVVVMFPGGAQVIVTYESKTSLLDLLPKINKQRRLRLYTDEYIFVVNNSDQKALKLMSPQLDMKTLVSAVGSCILEIQKKQYADFKKTSKQKDAAAALKDSKQDLQQAAAAAGKNIQFTETMANAYQEWNVVKKNKFGRKQERVFGVDGKKVYNSKKGKLVGGNETGVQRAERNIDTIIKIDILPNDSRTFKITWMDDRDVYNIEYTCDSSRDCAEIVNKVKFTLNKTIKTKAT